MKNGKRLIIIAIASCVLLYIIGMIIFGGKNLSTDMTSIEKNEVITEYELYGLNAKDVISFQHITYLQKRVNVLKIERNEINKKIISSNPHVEKIEEISKFGFPFPNCRFIPSGIRECYCFYDDNYYYLSVYYGGTEFNKTINDLFWKLYNK